MTSCCFYQSWEKLKSLSIYLKLNKNFKVKKLRAFWNYDIPYKTRAIKKHRTRTRTRTRISASCVPSFKFQYVFVSTECTCWCNFKEVYTFGRFGIKFQKIFWIVEHSWAFSSRAFRINCIIPWFSVFQIQYIYVFILYLEPPFFSVLSFW